MSRSKLGILLVIAMLTSLLAPIAVSAQDDTFTVGAIVPTLDAQFWNNYVQFMQEGADALGVELIVLNADRARADARTRHDPWSRRDT